MRETIGEMAILPAMIGCGLGVREATSPAMLSSLPKK